MLKVCHILFLGCSGFLWSYSTRLLTKIKKLFYSRSYRTVFFINILLVSILGYMAG